MDNFYNYYRLLGIPNCSNIDEIEEAYGKILITLNAQPHDAGNEFVVELEKGMSILRNIGLKIEYDRIIMAMDQTVHDSKFANAMYRKYGNSSRNPVHRFTGTTALPFRFMDGIETNGYKKIHVFLFFIITLIYLTAPFYIENLYWEPYSQSKLIIYSSLFLVHIPVTAIYTRWLFIFLVHRFKKTLRFAFRISTISFFAIFIAYPVLVYRGIIIEKQILLKKHAFVTPLKIDVDYQNNLYYYYRVNGQLYIQSEEAPERIPFGDTSFRNKMRIKYSIGRPEVSEVDNWNELGYSE